jgi:hypothetical protein
MVKRKKTDTVQLKLRIREALRGRLEKVAKAQDVSLNYEMAERLQASFDRTENALLLEALLGPEYNLELLRAISTMLKAVGNSWLTDQQKAHSLSDAIAKIIKVFSGEIGPVESNFPDRSVHGTSDQLAWIAVLVARLNATLRREGNDDAAPADAE